MKIVFLTGIAFLAFLFSCTSGRKYSCCKETLPFAYDADSGKARSADYAIDISHLVASINLYGWYVNSGFQIYNYDDSNYIAFLNSAKDTFIFVNITKSSDVKKYSTGIQNAGNEKYSLRIIGDTLHLMNTKSFNYAQYKISEDLRLIQQFSLRKFLNPKKQFVNTNIVVDKKMYFEPPYLLFNYGNYYTSNNIDKSVLLRVNLQTMEADRILQYPDVYKYCPVYHYFSLMEATTPGKFVLLFEKQDILFEVDLKSGQYIAESKKPEFRSNFICFDSKLASNIAYTSGIDLKDEDNSNLIYNNGSIYVIKRLRREKKSDPVKVAVLEFDSELNHTYTTYLHESLEPRISFGYGNGIAIANDSINKMYFYAFQNR